MVATPVSTGVSFLHESLICSASKVTYKKVCMDPEGKLPTLVFFYPDSFPEEIIENDLSGIKSNNLDFHVIKRDIGPYNGFEWIIPTAFGVYILKPYFDAFLSQAGKDHYDILKRSLKKLLEKGKQFETKTVASDKSPDKLSKSYTQSLTVSVEFLTINNRHVKLLFDKKSHFGGLALRWRFR